MERFVLRVWLPNRPGALGAVASRIGAVKGDVVGIEILEIGGGQAVDELVVQLPDATLLDLLVAEVRQVDGVQVEEIRPLGPADHDPRRATLETASALVGAPDRSALLTVARDVVPRSLSAAWLAVVDLEAAQTLAAGERSPSHAWLMAFVNGAPSAAPRHGTDPLPSAPVNDVIWAPAGTLRLALVAGRDQVAWRQRERGELGVLADMFALRWIELDRTVSTDQGS